MSHSLNVWNIFAHKCWFSVMLILRNFRTSSNQTYTKITSKNIKCFKLKWFLCIHLKQKCSDSKDVLRPLYGDVWVSYANYLLLAHASILYYILINIWMRVKCTCLNSWWIQCKRFSHIVCEYEWMRLVSVFVDELY